MKQNWPLIVWLGLMALIGHMRILATWTWPSLSSDEWAAWVQALGSIGAILASVWIALWLPSHQEDKRRKERQALAMLAVINSADELAQYLATAKQLAVERRINNGTFPLMAAGVRSTDQDLQGIGSLDLPSSGRIHLIAARATAQVTLMLMDHAHSELGEHRQVPSTFFDDALDVAEGRKADALKYIAKHPIGKTPVSGYH